MFSPNAVGAIRCITIGHRRIRQRLLAHSDVERSYQYAYCDVLPISQLRIALHVVATAIIPIIHGNRASVWWRATFESPFGHEAKWTTVLSEAFGRSATSLKRYLSEHISEESALDMTSFSAAQQSGEPELIAGSRELLLGPPGHSTSFSAILEVSPENVESCRNGEATRADATSSHMPRVDVERLWKTILDAAAPR